MYANEGLEWTWMKYSHNLHSKPDHAIYSSLKQHEQIKLKRGYYSAKFDLPNFSSPTEYPCKVSGSVLKLIKHMTKSYNY